MRFSPWETHQRARYFRFKYAVERMLGLGLLLVLSPWMLLIYALIRFTSPGPAVYKQERVGLNGRVFTVYKFRSMRVDSESDGKAVWCAEGDDRITPVGKWLRALHMDEWPQLVNVLLGEMTLTGPRPERPEIVLRLSREVAGYDNRHSVKPGLTGLAQVNLKPDQTLDDVRRKLIFDLYYIENANAWLDIRLILATGMRMFGIQGETVMRTLSLCRRGLLLDANLLDESRMDHGRLVPWALRQRSDRMHRFARVILKREGDRDEPAVSAAESMEVSAVSREAMKTIDNALTVDVEDYFQVTAFEKRVLRKDWDRLTSRVESNTMRLLQLMEESEVHGTFFVLGWVADRYPSLVKRIAAAGHQIASHGYWHRLNYNITPDEFAEDLIESRDAIASACGVEVTAYRAPSFSIVEDTTWALDVLTQLGYKSDSSIFPIRHHDRYGMPAAQKHIHKLRTDNGTILEFPPSIGSVQGVSVPIGGGYFRLFPYHMTSAAIDSVRSQGRPAMFYTHPWEYDPDQPRITKVGIKSRFRHYVGLEKTERRLRRMLHCHQFNSMANVTHQWQEATMGGNGRGSASPLG
ncbi:XrtA system polysaccharide deacetylase [Rubripirellula lacrimiformis]|nr:XrtA system polysaccharide deacetylase [Rubripirellula lacrimiformis]